MIFHELYSAYYTAVAHILRDAVAGEVTRDSMRRTVETYAFSESALAILPALREGRWPLLTPDGRTTLTSAPARPMTTLERRWLKAVLADPRVALFGITVEGLEDVTPLFTPDDYRVYDRAVDGDPYTDEGYITRFRQILAAIRTHTPLSVATHTRRGNRVWRNLMPERLEYSARDDKFRLISSGCRFGETVNLARIIAVMPYESGAGAFKPRPRRAPHMETVTLLIYDGRNCLERAMLHFAHFEKRTERLDDDHYRLTLRYSREDETELLIRILSFGPFVKVEGPGEMVDQIRERLRRQMGMGIK